MKNESKLPQRGSLTKKFMVYALAGVMGMGALGIGAAPEAKAGAFDNLLSNAAQAMSQQLSSEAAQAANRAVQSVMNGGQGMGDITQGAGERVIQRGTDSVRYGVQSGVQQTMQQQMNKIFHR